MPNSWRDHILQAFAPQVSRLTLVADPDSLLIEESILLELQARGYELLTLNDPVAFRFTYETKYRTSWDQNESTEQGLILRTEAEDLHALPHDLLQAGRHLTFTLGHLFSNLSAPVVAALGRSEAPRPKGGASYGQEGTPQTMPALTLLPFSGRYRWKLGEGLPQTP